ncbi:hypothetical protein [Stenotrophomonas sp. SY1]|uniref:hypothetical protein n=1 Tax=Stenotrophomonas sp. SY1 TaxID=477235 RepID=UPI001E5C5425|nr:hypothetical protein [Stenotrophomonas sp. SY1]MCD9086386.1 hypothetical protein [Stenotrophomonas sp. SY1]
MINNMWFNAALLGCLVGGIAPSSSLAAPGVVTQCTGQVPPRIVKLVYVEVTQGASGPVVTPEECVVRSGTQVVWRTAEDALLPFELTFAQSPGVPAGEVSGPADPKEFASRRMGKRQEVQIVAKNVTVASDIRYDVRIGAVQIDPGIKIMPR